MLKVASVTERNTLETVAIRTDLNRNIRDDWWKLINAQYMELFAAVELGAKETNVLGRLAMIKDSRIKTTGLFILSLYVPQDQRRKGVASRLLNHADIVGAEQGVRTLSLDVASDNKPAIELYEKHGYAVTDYGEVYEMAKIIE